MFNGIIFNIEKIKSIKKNKNSFFISIETKLKFSNKDLGSSISCNGVCLTVVKVSKNLISFYISKETLNKSNLRFINLGQIINLEKSLTYGQKISGHFTQGHVDTIARVSNIIILDKTWLVRFKIDNVKYTNLIVEKASISINGVSLTISKVINNFFEINIIPHTLKLTNLNNLKLNDVVNVELDIFSKYMYKYSN